MYFLMEMFFLSYVNDTMYLLWNLPFFKMVPPKTKFFLFSNLGLTNAIFLMEMFFLSYVNEIMCLLWNLPFFKMFPPKTNFFLSFIKHWVDNDSTNQYFCQLFYGWGMTHLMPSYLTNTYCGRGNW